MLGLEFELRVAAAATVATSSICSTTSNEAVAARLLDDVGLDRFRFTHALVQVVAAQ